MIASGGRRRAMEKNLLLRSKRLFSDEGLSLTDNFPGKMQTSTPKTTLTQGLTPLLLDLELGQAHSLTSYFSPAQAGVYMQI